MNNKKIKICGVKTIATINTCIKNKVNFFGLVFFNKSPRYISISKAKKLIEYSKNKKIKAVGVFVNLSIEKLSKIIEQTNLKYIQLHGNENDHYMHSIKKKYNVKIIKSIGVKNKRDLEILKKLKNADYFLFDYKPKSKELPGGNAKKFNWKVLKDIKIGKPWFISGGININNVKEIGENIFPYGIDISSGVEAKLGIKSPRKINDLMKKIND